VHADDGHHHAALGAVVDHKIAEEKKEEHPLAPQSGHEDDDNKPNHVVLQLSQGRSGSTVVSVLCMCVCTHNMYDQLSCSWCVYVLRETCVYMCVCVCVCGGGAAVTGAIWKHSCECAVYVRM
jgi:hypothetical protein